MKRVDVLIIGGSAAGITAALTARRFSKEASITLIRREKEVLVPCGIPYIFQTIGDVKKNLIPDGVLLNKNIEILVDEAVDINRAEKTVTLKSGEKIGYGKLVLATGSNPVVPKIKGIELQNIYTIKKDVEYLARLSAEIDKAKNVVIIGGGFIGVEVADDLSKKGLNISIIEMLPHCLQLAFDEEFYTLAEENLRNLKVNLVTGTTAEEFIGKEKVEGVKLSNGETLKADLVIIAIGTYPNTELAQKAGLKIGEQKGIWVDEYMRTVDEDIFAAGDCAEKTSFFTGKPTALRLASLATMEARVAGANVYSLKRKNPGAIGSFSTMVGGLALGVAGLTENAAKQAGFNYVIGEFAGPDRHPPVMPGCRELRVKLLFDKSSGKLLGGQVAGGASTAEIVNMLTVMISRGFTVEETAIMQFGTHPALTCSPISYPVSSAAEDALSKF
ncbi:MAG: pyridine nucleotide-disulfide oxidoreductase [Candidatus Hecatellales archaeon]|nr:MAG: pyridine nucleotide-disulfide oxidoreductase [Candidatus Hecatellales archaeon]